MAPPPTWPILGSPEGKRDGGKNASILSLFRGSPRPPDKGRCPPPWVPGCPVSDPGYYPQIGGPQGGPWVPSESSGRWRKCQHFPTIQGITQGPQTKPGGPPMGAPVSPSESSWVLPP